MLVMESFELSTRNRQQSRLNLVLLLSTQLLRIQKKIKRGLMTTKNEKVGLVAATETS